MHLTNVGVDSKPLSTAGTWLFIVLLALFIPALMETLKSLWVNWGWSYPFTSSLIVAGAAVIAWWVFGGVITLATPKSVTKDSTEVRRATQKAFSEMTNRELREATVRFASRLRKFSSDYRQTADELTIKEWLDYNTMVQKIPEAERETPERKERIAEIQAQVIARMKSRGDQFQDSFRSNYLIDAQLLDKELRKRVNIQAVISDPGSGPLIPKGKPAWALEGKLAGPDPVGDLANYLESLAKQLPPNDE